MHYDERLHVPLRWWAQGTMLVASLWLAMVVALPPTLAWVLTGVAMALMAGWFISFGSPRIQVTDQELRAGRAHVEFQFLGAVTPLDSEAARRAAGVDADARAYLLLRPYLKQAVRVDLTDADDPTPYWLLSTRHPQQLADALSRV